MYNPRTWVQDRKDEATKLAELLGSDWTADGMIVKHSNGSVGLMGRGLAVRFDNSVRVDIPETATIEEIAAILTEVAK
jgi:hypothetical protein